MSEEHTPSDELDVYLRERYELAEQAGEGGASTVHRAKRRADGRDVVIKVHTATADGALARFRREARLLAELKHPRIVRLLEVLELGDRPGLVMECVPGGSLRDALERDRRLPAVRAVALTRDILEGLEVLHGHGVIHRDVKPENVLIGPDGRALLADLGVARADDEDSLTGKGCVVGTPRYMAPELLHNQEPSPSVDLYAVGLVLFEVLTGQAAIDLDHFPKIVLFHHDGNRPPRIRALDPALPESLDALVHELTEPDPARRPADARAAIAKLDGAVRAGISAAISRPRPSRAVPALKPKPPQATRKIPALAQAPIEPPPRSRALWLLVLLTVSAVAGMAAAYLRRPAVVPPKPVGLRAVALQGRITAAGRMLDANAPLAFGEELEGPAHARITLGLDDRELDVAFAEASAFTLSETPRGRRLLVRTGRIGLRSAGGLVELKTGGSAIVSAPTSH